MVKKIPKCPICGGPHYKSFCWQNPKRGYNLRKKYEKAYKTGKVPRGEKTLSKETTKRKRLIMELDKYCSLIVRIGASDKYGNCLCYICGRKLPYRQMHNGHYKSRQFLGTRFDFDNMRVSCPTCLTGDAELYLWNFTPIKQKNIKKGDMILARNPISDGVMIVEVEEIAPMEVEDTYYLEDEKIEGNLGHLIETTDGFVPIEKAKNYNIIKIWKR